MSYTLQVTRYTIMQKGFTLIEILVTITIFFIAIVSFLSLFVSAFRYQMESLGSAYLLNNTSFVSDYLSRALRMAQKDMEGTCIQTKYNFENPGEDSSKIRFLNYQGKCQEFLLENNQLKIRKSSDRSYLDLGQGEVLTPNNLTVETLRFAIIGENQDDTIQPKVTYILKLKTKQNPSQILNLQTTISQRELDVKY